MWPHTSECCWRQREDINADVLDVDVALELLDGWLQLIQCLGIREHAIIRC